MKSYPRIKETHEIDQFPIADGQAVIDNLPMPSNLTKSASSPLIRRLEHWLISLGMSVIAYLLERVILRSIKNDGAKL
ncbi:MAG: hypothetical protein CV090_06690 [Nitrospira sp. WS238]|nr:hypothetical protein [Nitrospira sp. WS238]